MNDLVFEKLGEYSDVKYENQFSIYGNKQETLVFCFVFRLVLRVGNKSEMSLFLCHLIMLPADALLPIYSPILR